VTSRTPRIAALAGAAALVLAACGGTDDAPDTGAGGIEVPAREAPTGGPTGDREDPGPSGGSGAADLPPRPQPGTCVDVPEAADGRYAVYDAGTAVVTREGDRLVLGDVRAAAGWTARVDDEEPDEVEIDFRRDGQDVLDLEVELDGARVRVEICADDD
jgi:hypothetical protein